MGHCDSSAPLGGASRFFAPHHGAHRVAAQRAEVEPKPGLVARVLIFLVHCYQALLSPAMARLASSIPLAHVTRKKHCNCTVRAAAFGLPQNDCSVADHFRAAEWISFPSAVHTISKHAVVR